MRESVVVPDITPVLKLIQTRYTNGLRRVQDFHDFVFNHDDQVCQLAALMDLFTFFGYSAADRYVDVVDETSELFAFSAKERREIDGAIMIMIKKGEITPDLVFRNTTPEEGALIALFDLTLLVHELGPEGRALYLWRLLTEFKSVYACPISG